MRALFFGLLGPLVALIVIWQPPVSIAHVPEGPPLPAELVERLRQAPEDAVLAELRDFAVSYPQFRHLDERQAPETADEVLESGTYGDGAERAVPVPFRPGEYLAGGSTWDLGIASFAVPSLLGRAYEVSGSQKYLQAAVGYVLDWADYEGDLWLPRGLIFNDHAMAARAIVVTELWRLYRSSEIYRPERAAELLVYVRTLSRRLQHERTYEYRSNHGVMQNLSLLHLATAFPSLFDAGQLSDVARERLNLQLEYFVNEEGVVLEHSAGYHWNGIGRLSAAWRYLGLNDIPVPDSMVRRYESARDFSAALGRPDRTLPVIGDTDDEPHSPYLVADFGEGRIVSGPLRPVQADDLVPVALTVAAGAGYVVLWNGLRNWPDPAALDQTVFHWANFPSGIHKHADELGVSIWAGGTQWVRGVGYWPYVPSRSDAIGWRSSNAPHWMAEDDDVDRSSSLSAYASDDRLSYFDAVRTASGGREIRRQVARFGAGTWVVVDSFPTARPRGAETVWRFSPDLALQQQGPERVDIAADGQHMRVLFGAVGGMTVDADPDASAPWNNGLIASGEIVAAPAVRVRTGSDAVAHVTAFEWQDGEFATDASESAELHWNGESDWSVRLSPAQGPPTVLRRTAGSIVLEGPHVEPKNLELSPGMSDAALDARQQALEAYGEAMRLYGEPVRPLLSRRTKVSVVVLLAAAGQVILFLVVARSWRRLWPPLLLASSAAWVGLVLFLRMHFLV